MKSQKDIHAQIRTNSGWWLLVFLFLVSSFLQAQNRSELEAKRKRLIQEINQTTTQLKATQATKEEALQRFFTLQKQIQKRKQLIRTLKKEILYAEKSISRSKEVLTALESDVSKLKTEYAKMIRVAYRHHLNNSWLQFLFSAQSFNEAFKRWQYLKQYDRYRKKQARLIFETQKRLSSRMESLEGRKEQKKKLLSAQEQQRHLMNKELTDKDQILKHLKDDESRLVADLSRQQKAHLDLNEAIEDIIRKELAKNKKESRTADALSAANNNKARAEELDLTGSFMRNKGRLSWPVQDGVITRKFGKQPHPKLKSIKITNNGIDIKTTPESRVFAIFDGEVAGTQFIPGYKNMIIIKHGSYYTVYSNLEELLVKKGDKIRTKQSIGTVGNEHTEVHFEVWREKQRLNPVNWITQKK